MSDGKCEVKGRRKKDLILAYLSCSRSLWAGKGQVRTQPTRRVWSVWIGWWMDRSPQRTPGSKQDDRKPKESTALRRNTAGLPHQTFHVKKKQQKRLKLFSKTTAISTFKCHVDWKHTSVKGNPTGYSDAQRLCNHLAPIYGAVLLFKMLNLHNLSGVWWDSVWLSQQHDTSLWLHALKHEWAITGDNMMQPEVDDGVKRRKSKAFIFYLAHRFMAFCSRCLEETLFTLNPSFSLTLD